MSISDWTGIATGIITIYLAWQQNQIFKYQNGIFAAQAGQKPMSSEPVRAFGLRQYWPTLGLVLLVFVGIGYHERSIASRWEGSPEPLYMGYWGPESRLQDGRSYLSIKTFGKYFISKKSAFQLAGVAFKYEGVDPLEANDPYKSSLYEIRDEMIDLQILVPPTFMQRGLGTNYALLLIPKGVSTNQFSTLHQAQGLGVVYVQHFSGVP